MEEVRLIRTARIEDLPAIAALRTASFRYAQHGTIDTLAAYLRSVFFDNPWRLREPASLVWENEAGTLVGFLGVIARPMRFGNEEIVSATLSTFMVDASQRGRGIGGQLMRHFLAGPQDLAFSDVANAGTRDLWRALGGDVAWLHNLYWTKALRPMRAASVQWIRGASSYAASLAARPLAAVVDPIVTRMPGMPQQVTQPPGRVEPLRPDVAASEIERLAAECVIRPSYTGEALGWLFDQLNAKPNGRLECMLVRDADDAIAGWFVYFVNPRGTAEVVQVVAPEREAGLVLDHLTYHAWRAGVVALSGRLDEARLLPAMSTRGFMLARRDPWVMVHARRLEIAAAIHRGDALLSRLEGEWWMVA
jgi:ribosomal protein S18 acetylase RimI-like enzyme